MRLPSQLAQAPYRFQPHAAIVIRAFSEADSERIGVQLAVARHGAEPLAVRAIDQAGGDEVPAPMGSATLGF